MIVRFENFVEIIPRSNFQDQRKIFETCRSIETCSSFCKISRVQRSRIKIWNSGLKAKLPRFEVEQDLQDVGSRLIKEDSKISEKFQTLGSNQNFRDSILTKISQDFQDRRLSKASKINHDS